METILHSFVAFIVALGLLVTVHEYGHFWVARRLGVRVLRFSIGFGRPLLRWRRRGDPVEYVVAAIPLGGYVKMLDEREGPVPSEWRDQAFNRQPVWTRIAVAAAGPLANLLLAVVLFALVYLAGVDGIRPIVGEVVPDSPAAAAGFAPRDELLAVDGVPVSSWQDARTRLLDAVIDGEPFEVRVRTAAGAEALRRFGADTLRVLKDDGDLVANLGLGPWWPPIEPEIVEVQPGGAADAAGLRAGDRLLTVDGEPIQSLQSWVERVRAHPGRPLRLEVERDGVRFETTLVPGVRRNDAGEEEGFAGVMVRVPEDAWEALRVTVRLPPHRALWAGVEKTWETTRLSFAMIGRLITGEASMRNISGPISIAEYAGRSARIDLGYFLYFLAFISVSLAVLNLLPIPLLDGGHLLYYAAELIRGRPLPESVELAGQRLGLMIIAALIALALYNDLSRLLG
ncbi:MAG: regulator of sigma E protease [Gammaproteobacteria bacterium]|nr:MAG: regulator of sigma E protease [Gammaproteobacteria bacterium]